MDMKRLITLLIMAIFLASSASSRAADSELRKKFAESLDANNEQAMTSVVANNRDKVPSEIKTLLDEAFSAAAREEKESKLFMAERMAKIYNDVTGDEEPLKGVKRRSFESRLSPPAASAPVNGVHIIETVLVDPAAKEYAFKPDNIVIKAGETVRWVNRDDSTHMIGAAPLIGGASMLSPRLEPGQSWEHKFDKPGDYYYLCFIHKIMYGKITVEK